MILITKVETVETDKDIAELHRLAWSNDNGSEFLPLGDQVVEAKVLREVIKGRRFVDTKRGIDVILGVSTQAGKYLGLYYGCFERMQDQVNTLKNNCDYFKNELAKARVELDKIKSYNFFQRLKFLLFGYKKT